MIKNIEIEGKEYRYTEHEGFIYFDSFMFPENNLLVIDIFSKMGYELIAATHKGLYFRGKTRWKN